MANNITVHGNIGSEPELRYTQAGMAVLEFSVADTYGRDDKKKTTWHNVVCFGQLAENVAGSAEKGSNVIVMGRFEQDEYTKKDGTKGKVTKVIADEVGMSCRWSKWVKDQTDSTMAKIGKVFPNATVAGDQPF